MTNEEAIKVLTNHRRFVFEYSEEDIAIVMGISALKNNHIPKNTAETEIRTEESAEQTDLLNILIKEYLSKCECCDECFAEYFCIKNDLRESREPKDYCIENIKQYLSVRNSIDKAEQTAKEDTAELQVELEGDGYYNGELVYDFGKCPNCGWDFEEGDKDWEQPYCCHCGQKLHWFD